MIPDAAVEAAVEAHCEGTMRDALEAAAPHIIAEWEERRQRQASEAFQALSGRLRVAK